MSTPSYQYDVCQQANHVSVVWDNKIYALGGYNAVTEVDGAEAILISNSYLRIIDFTKSSDFTRDNITTIIRVPDTIPRTKWATAWVNDGKIYMFGGEHELYKVEDENGVPSNATRPTPDGTIWEYDIAGNTWNGIPDGTKTIQPIVRAQSVFDSTDKTEYILGGVIEMGQYYVANGSYYPARPAPSVSLSNLVTYNMENQVWTNKTNDISLGSIEQGRMFYFGELGTKGALVVVGGRVDGSPKAMDSINLYDIDTTTWYTQTATAEAGNFPPPRREYCAVSVSSTDGTSHNIYLYGGVDQDHEDTVTTALSDVWILTLPYFRWVNAGRAPIGKSALTCDLLSQRYMVAYRGRNGGSATDFHACDQESNPAVIQGLNIFDITSLSWTTEYVHPTGTPTYQVPQKLISIIGGSADGDANITAPKNGFVDDKLAAIFSAAVTRSTSTSSSTSSTSSTNTSITENPSSSSTPVGAIAGGVIGGIAVLAAIVGLLFWRRRRNKAKAGDEIAEVSGTTARQEMGGIPVYQELPAGMDAMGPKYEMPAALPPVEMDATRTPRKPVPRSSFPS